VATGEVATTRSISFLSGIPAVERNRSFFVVAGIASHPNFTEVPVVEL
jgi:hypothetical protein